MTKVNLSTFTLLFAITLLPHKVTLAYLNPMCTDRSAKIQFIDGRDQIVYSTIPSIVTRLTGFVKLGEGSFGTVYQTTYENKQVALKQMKITDMNVSEINHLVNLKGTPGVPEIFACEKGTQFLYLVQELLYKDLNEEPVLEKIMSKPLQERLKLFLGVAETLLQVHKKRLIHHDIKPENMMANNENVDRIYLIDFGLTASDTSGIVAGSPLFWTPEIVSKRNRVANYKTDVWALVLSFAEIEFTSSKVFHNVLTCIKLSFSEECHKDLMTNISKAFVDANSKIVSECGEKTLNYFKEMFTMGLSYENKDRLDTQGLITKLGEAINNCAPQMAKLDIPEVNQKAAVVENKKKEEIVENKQAYNIVDQNKPEQYQTHSELMKRVDTILLKANTNYFQDLKKMNGQLELDMKLAENKNPVLDKLPGPKFYDEANLVNPNYTKVEKLEMNPKLEAKKSFTAKLNDNNRLNKDQDIYKKYINKDREPIIPKTLDTKITYKYVENIEPKKENMPQTTGKIFNQVKEKELIEEGKNKNQHLIIPDKPNFTNEKAKFELTRQYQAPNLQTHNLPEKYEIDQPTKFENQAETTTIKKEELPVRKILAPMKPDQPWDQLAWNNIPGYKRSISKPIYQGGSDVNQPQNPLINQAPNYPDFKPERNDSQKIQPTQKTETGKSRVHDTNKLSQQAQEMLKYSNHIRVNIDGTVVNLDPRNQKQPSQDPINHLPAQHNFLPPKRPEILNRRVPYHKAFYLAKPIVETIVQAQIQNKYVQNQQPVYQYGQYQPNYYPEIKREFNQFNNQMTAVKVRI